MERKKPVGVFFWGEGGGGGGGRCGRMTEYDEKHVTINAQILKTDTP